MFFTSENMNRYRCLMLEGLHWFRHLLRYRPSRHIESIKVTSHLQVRSPMSLPITVAPITSPTTVMASNSHIAQGQCDEEKPTTCEGCRDLRRTCRLAFDGVVDNRLKYKLTNYFLRSSKGCYFVRMETKESLRAEYLKYY